MTPPPRTTRTWRALALTSVMPLLVLAIGTMPASATSHQPTTRLGTADDFAILAGSTITNTGRSVIAGDVGLHPGTAVTGFESCTGPANCVDQTGAMHVTDGVAEEAKSDLLTTYNELVGLEETCTPLVVELGDTTLTPGVYCSPTFGLTGDLTLSGIGEFIFLTGAGGSELTTAAGSQVLLTNGADSCSVYWQVASSATIGAGSAFAGNILAHTSISFGAGATLDGSALALGAAVTLIANTITDTTCAAATPPDGGDDDGTPPDGGDDDGTPDGGDDDGDDGSPSTDTDSNTNQGGSPSDDDDAAALDEDGLTTLEVRNLTASQGRSTDGRGDRDESGSSQDLAKTGPPIQLHLLVALLCLIIGGRMIQISSRPVPARARSHGRRTSMRRAA